MGLGWVVAAIAKGTDVYLFLTGMMLLSELARREGVFDWLAALAIKAAKGSRARLFTLIYLVGTVVTVFLSNDATAVVLTPAVCAALRRAGGKALPYLLICAFIANAASFVLPISNPANLVVYGKSLPPLMPWLRTFLIPSIVSIVVTYVALRWISRRDLEGRIEDGAAEVRLTGEGRWAAWGILGTGGVLIGASAWGLDLGLPTCVVGIVTVLLVTRGRGVWHVVKGVSWSALSLVAGLFVVVDWLSAVGALREMEAGLRWCVAAPRLGGAVAAAFGIAVLSNVMNNLPSGLMVGGALQAVHAPAHIRDAVLIGVDLGPNLSVTGSLATVLWLVALRREGEKIGAWQFLKAGMVVMPPALFLAAGAVLLGSR